MVIHAKRRKNSSEALVDRLPGTWSKLEMKVLRHIVGRVRSRAGAMWKGVAPHRVPSVARGVAADMVRSRRELVIENALLRHQIVILRRKSPHPRLTTVDRLRLLAAAAVLPTWRRAVARIADARTGLKVLRDATAGGSRRRACRESIAVMKAREDRLHLHEHLARLRPVELDLFDDEGLLASYATGPDGDRRGTSSR